MLLIQINLVSIYNMISINKQNHLSRVEKSYQNQPLNYMNFITKINSLCVWKNVIKNMKI
jgi:hypothetical protein